MLNASSHDKNSSEISIYDPVSGTIQQLSRVVKSDFEWRKILTQEQYRVARKKGTEKAFSGSCSLGETGGYYACVCCATALFRVEEKFESGTGWPSFWNPVSEYNISERSDETLGLSRTEVICSRCDAHLGHVFDDGPAPTYKRYCINSVSIKFMPAQKKELKLEKAVFAGGCFWGVEEAFRVLDGVVSTKAGYTGGTIKNPSYEDVCSGRTGHTEAVEVEYNPSIVSYDKLLEIFWNIHDPTTLNRQGPDIGTQYRSAIFYASEEQKESAEKSRAKLEKSGRLKKKIVTDILPASEFFPAEDYHQKYHMKHGVRSCPR